MSVESGMQTLCNQSLCEVAQYGEAGIGNMWRSEGKADDVEDYWYGILGAMTVLDFLFQIGEVSEFGVDWAAVSLKGTQCLSRKPVHS